MDWIYGLEEFRFKLGKTSDVALNRILGERRSIKQTLDSLGKRLDAYGYGKDSHRRLMEEKEA